MFHISVTIGVFLKKIVTLLLLDKRTWKTIGLILSIAITIVLLPAIVIISMGGQFTESVDHINQDDFMQSLSVEQQEQFSQMESDGKAIEKELSTLGASNETVKAQVIYLTYFDDVQKDEKFFNTYCQIFKNSSDDETLITGLNFMYKKNINYEEFKRSYAMIENVNINKYRFLNLDKKNNIDLARWAVNAYETAWGYVPHTIGNVLETSDYKDLKEKYPDEITIECDKWKRRRTADNFGLVKSYLCYDAENRKISDKDFNKGVKELYDTASVKGNMEAIPDRLGTAVINGDMIGICVGNGEVIYAKSVNEGIVRENISDGDWKAWFEIPDIEYGEESKFKAIPHNCKNTEKVI